jgi:tRNA(Ile)-lysidine synthase
VIHVHLDDPVTRALRLCFQGETVLAAVSGGPDSMAMFHALCEMGGAPVIAAHFDHQLRPDSRRDAEVVECAAARVGVRVVRGEGNVASHARGTRQSTEAAARELRYAFLERTADETGAHVIATAHTRDDQIETVMMRLLRGANARGLRGIPARRGRIVRPLLGVTHTETRAYCDARSVSYVDDPGNSDRRFFRNRIRHDVLPALRGVYPDLDAALERIARAAHARFDAAEAATRERIQRHLRADDTAWILALDAFDGLNDEYRAHLVSAVLDAIGERDDVTREHHRAVLRLRPGASVDLPRLRVRREHDAYLFARRTAREPHREGRNLEVPGGVHVGDWRITSRRMSSAEALAVIRRRDPLVACLAAEGPFVVRLAQPGDRMQPFGMRGHKKLSDLFIDRKIPRREREQMPVVERDGEILWIAGVATSECARVGRDTRDVVRITATRDGRHG